MRKISGYRILGNRLFMTIECSQSVHSIVYCLFRRATDGARTRDLHLGKVAYYQLYYCRIFLSLMYLSDEIYNNTVSSAWQAFS